jgi:uncharacterized membrane protein YraQ (UPF0718 family)
MNVFNIFNDIFLKMVWLSDLVFSLLENIFQLDSQSTLFGILHFFIYDTIKIFILLSFLIFLVSYIQSYFPPERTTKILGRFKGITGNILGALLGTITPFCSCSSIPIFIGFTRAGLPLGVTFSFLISSPLVDLASFLILMSFLGPQIAIAYVIVGLILAVLGGLIIDKAKMEDYLQDYVVEMRKQGNTNDLVILEMTKKDRVKFSFDQVLDIIKRVWLYVLIGVGIGSTIHNVIPEDVIGYILGGNNPFNVLIASVVGIPMYADIFGTIPIAEALLGKGVGIGTILAFMMSVTALSLPSMVMLSKVVKKRLLFTFIGIVSFGIIIIGYLFNILEFIV